MMLINKYKNTNVAIKASFWYTICSFLQKGISFFIVPIYTRALTTEEYGVYGVFQSWREILMIFATLNLYSGVFTKAMVDLPEDRDNYTSSMQSLSTLITVCLFAVVLLFRYIIPDYSFLSEDVLIVMFVYFVFYPSFLFWSVRQKVEYRYQPIIIVTLITTIAIPILSIYLLFSTNYREKSIIYGNLIINIAVGAFFYILNYSKSLVMYNKEYWKQALKFNIPLIPHYLSLIILGHSSKIIIDNLCGSGDAGLYNLALQASMVMSIIMSSINGSYVPWMYDSLKKHSYSSINNTSMILIDLFGLLSICAILVSPEAVFFLGSNKYFRAIWAIPPVVLGSFYSFCFGLLSSVEFYYSETKYITITSLVGGIANICISLILIPIFGFTAAGYSTAISYFIVTVIHFIFYKKICHKKEVNEPIIAAKPFFFRIIIITCITIILTSLYEKALIRYLVVLLLATVTIVRYKKAINIFRRKDI